MYTLYSDIIFKLHFGPLKQSWSSKYSVLPLEERIAYLEKKDFLFTSESVQFWSIFPKALNFSTNFVTTWKIYGTFNFYMQYAMNIEKLFLR